MSEQTLECADCRVKIKAEVEHAFRLMSAHTEEKHGRKPLFSEEQYRHLTRGTRMISTLILNPDLIGAA